MPGDEHRPGREAILQAYGVEATTTPGGRPARAPGEVAPPSLGDATAPKVRRPGRGVEIAIRPTFGTAAPRAAAPKAAAASRAVEVSSPERRPLTDRHRNARKRRKTDCFSRRRAACEAATCLTLDGPDCCWPARPLRARSPDGPWRGRPPAPAAGLTDHVWSLAEWSRSPAIKRE